jgi:diguanylate cyclase (GGDEF)-like protein/PAS domain S-box-containing protein
MTTVTPLNILLLENRSEDAELTLNALCRAGFAPRGPRVDNEADFLAALNPDLDVILADYSLPQLDATRALACVRERGFDIPFIVVTGTVGEETAVATVRGGATDFLLKDRLGRLGEAVWAALDRRRLRREAEAVAAALRASEARFRALVQHAPDLIAVVRADGIVRYASPAVERMLGIPADEVVGTDGFALLHPADIPAMRAAFAAAVAAPQRTATAEGRLRHRDGSWRWFEAITTNLLDEPTIGGIVLNARDISERKRAEEQLAHRTFHDPLTGLPNRALLLDRLEHALARAQRQETTVALFCLDLDRFDAINHGFGHAAGDAVLREATARLTRATRQSDTVARLRGDEFVVMLEEIADATEAIRVAEHLLEELHHPVRVDGRQLGIGATLGIAFSAPPVPTAADLLRDATAALTDAKTHQPGGYALFAPERHARAVADLVLEGELRSAMERAELRVHYQPIVDMTTGNVTAVEALVRWEHPRHGLLSPIDFLPLAEKTGLIVSIGKWVLAEACHQFRAWHTADPALPLDWISVNVAAAQLRQSGFIGTVKRVLEETGLPATSLRLEITEQVLMEDLRTTAPSLRALRRLGVRLAIDDFGVGYSSLGYLRELDADILKIDRSFVAELGQEGTSAKIVRAVRGLAHDLGMRATAEGIETDEQWTAALAVGCDLGQGFRFAGPATAEEIEALLRSSAATGFQLPDRGDTAGMGGPPPRSRKRGGRAAPKPAVDSGEDDVPHEGNVANGIAALGQ